MAVKNIVLPIPLSSVNSAGFSGAYVLLSGAGGITKACISLRIVNDSSIDVTVSFDGVNDHGFVPNGTEWNIDFQTNSQPQNNVCCLPQFTRVYVKAAAGAGFVYLSGFYQPQGV